MGFQQGSGSGPATREKDGSRRFVDGTFTVTLRTPQILTVLAVVVWSSVAAYQMAASGIRHDYGAYIAQWSHTLAGGDPWQVGEIPFNAYGPLHSFIAYAAIPSFMIPKFLFGMGIIILNFLLVMNLLEKGKSISGVDWFAYLLLIPFNFLVVGSVFLFGNNDGLVAALVGFAVLARLRGFNRAVGVFLGLAILLKLYPLLLLPFLIMNGRRFLLRPLIWAILTVAIGFLAALVRWGTSFVNAFVGGTERDATILSILNFAKVVGIGGPLYESFVDLNILLVLVGVSGLLFLCLFYRVDWLVAASLAMLLMAVLYKVGHQQFLVTWIVLLATLLISQLPRGRKVVFVSLPLVIGLSAYQFWFVRLWIEGTFWENEGFFLRVQAAPILFLTSVCIVAYTLMLYRRDASAIVSEDVRVMQD